MSRNQPRLRVALASATLRTLEDKATDMLSSKDLSILANGTNQTAAINTALTQLGALTVPSVLVLLPGTVYTEASLVIPDKVIVEDHTQEGRIRFLCNDRSGAGSITQGGIVVKSTGTSGVLLRNDDYGVTGDPYLEIRNEVIGAVAGISVGNIKQSGHLELSEIASPSAPADGKARLFVRAGVGGRTELCIRYNTGAIQVINGEP